MHTRTAFKATISSILGIIATFLPVLVVGQEIETPKESPFDVHSYEKFLWGIRAGFNVTTPHFEDADARDELHSQTTLGYTIGAVAQFKLTNRYAFQAEVGYSRKTHRFTFEPDLSENRMDMDIIDMSLLLRRRFMVEWGKSIRSDIFIGVGPNINYWMDATGLITTSAGESPYNIVFDGVPDANYNNMYLNGINRWLFGIDIGAGINFPITPKQKVFVELRASLGQTNLGGSSSSAFINLIGFGGSAFQENLLKSNLKSFSITAAYTFSLNYMQSKMGRSSKDKMEKRKKPAKRKRR